MSKILITGIAGLVGSNFAKYLLENKKDDIELLVGIDNLSGGYSENISHNIAFHNIDLVKDKNQLNNLFKHYDFDYVYHCAAYAAENMSPFIRKFNYDTNLVASSRLISNSIQYNIKRFVFFSSLAVYGHGIPPFIESLTPCPNDPYGISKYAVEMDLRVAQEQHGLDYCVVRPYNLYGPSQNIWDKYRNCLGIWMYQILNDKPITIFGDGLQKRAFTYIDNILEPLYNTTKDNAKNEIINLGDSKEYTIKEAAETLINIIGKGEITYLEPRHEVKEAWCDNTKAKNLLEYNDKISLEEGLTRMWNWALEQPMRKQKTWKKLELDKGIYEYWKNS